MSDMHMGPEFTSPHAHEARREFQDEAQPSAKRLKKEEAERTRVSRACDRCKQKKTRCSGRHPCTLCVRVGLSCEFTAAYTRGRVPSVPSDDPNQSWVTTEHNRMRSTAQSVSQINGGAIHAIRQPEGVQPGPSQKNITARMETPVDQTDSRVQSSRNSPEPSQTDLQGHYVGPSSGVSFLLRVQKKLHEKVSFSANSSIFTFGDAPLPAFDSSFFVLPPKADAEKLVARYFDFAVATHRFLHRPTVDAWLEGFYENLGVMQQRGGAKERTALLFMVFAQAKEYMPALNSVDTSARYFQAAEHQLSSETGEIRLTSVQARLCQCFYLLSQSRVNHCWSLFGTTAHLILALGIHRKRRLETSNGVDLIDLECRKRVFWCSYGLDNYLSAALGRPRTFHDDDIDQELPNCVNDSDLTSQRIYTGGSKAQSVMMASVAHNTLSKIISLILRDLYAIKAPSLTARVALSAKYSLKLIEWRKSLSKFLDADGFDPSLLIPLFQRQRNVLNLAYYHALILVHRPFLLSNFASLSRNNRHRGAPGTPDMDKNVTECLEAAMNIAAIVNELTEGKQIFRAFWFTQYFAFCAVVVLYVYTIQQRHSPQDKYRRFFDTAAKCQTQISSIAERESLAQRYSVVLEELRLEAVKQTQEHPLQVRNQGAILQGAYPSQAAIPQVNGSSPYNQTGFVPIDESFANPEGGVPEGPGATTPSSLMAELTSWGEFDHLVTAGIGGLDFMFMGDQIKPWDESAGMSYGGTTMS